MAFDTNAAAQGALAGTAIYPGIGTAAGFVLGGFLGGSFASGNKKQRRTLERKIRRRQDPAYLAKRVAEYTPLARRAVVEGGAANILQQEVQGNISRRGLTGTGLGTAFQNAAALAPAQFAAQTALELGQNSVNNEINSIMGMGQFNQPDISTLSRQSAGDIATAIAIFRSLKGKTGAKTGSPNPGGFESNFPRNSDFPYQPYNPASAMRFSGATGGFGGR